MLQNADGIAAFVAPIARAAEPWRALYSDSTLVSTSVLFVHLGALVASGGLAVATDRALIRSRNAGETALAWRLDEVALSHASVAFALAIAFLSGILLLLADVEAFAVMPAFWIKMGLIALLTMNALLMRRHERRLRAMADGEGLPAAVPNARVAPSPERAWARMRQHAWASMLLWFAIVLAGTAMTTT
jgi:hypothetical protein